MARTLVVPDRREQCLAWLRRRFAEHNQLVLLLAVLTLFVAAGLWFVLFAVLFWLSLLFTSVADGVDAQRPDILPALFIYAAGLLLLLTWLAGSRFANAPLKDKKSPLEIAAESLLAVPRATLAVWGNLSAWQKLDEREMGLATDLIARLLEERRVPLHQVPLDIPEPRDRMKILLALQLIEVLRVTRSDETLWLSLAPKNETSTRG